MSAVIRVQNLSKCYQIYERPEDRLKQSLWRGKKQFYREFWALHDVSFEMQRGETIGIIGRNGSGKSTLLQLIAGTLNPSAGCVEVKGRVAALLELGSGFNPDFSGRENVYLNGAILGLSREDIHRRFDEIASFADIGDFIEQPVKTYSSGMMLRLAFAVSVCVDPDILIVDEALAVGDMGFQFKCMERLQQLCSSGTSLLFVSHDISTVKAFCQRVIYLVKGEVRGIGSASDMAEMYLLDMRDEQKRAATGSSQVHRKPALGGENAVAFGTHQGRVTKACFCDTGSSENAYIAGDLVQIRIDVEFDTSVENLAVVILIQDVRMIALTGQQYVIERQESGACSVVFSFPAAFNTGRYFVTVRLDSWDAGRNAFPIDKQVAALSFFVNHPESRFFHGLIELPIKCEQLSGEADGATS